MRAPRAPLIAALAAFAALAAAAAPVITGPEARAFLGGRTGKIAYLKGADRQIYFVDFNDSVLVERPLSSELYCHSPMIHDDGTRVLYEQNSAIWIRDLVSNAPARTLVYSRPIKPGQIMEPRWWTDPKDSAQYVLFVTGVLEDATWPPSSGVTYAQKLDKAFKPVGPPTTVMPFMMSAGRSRNGMWGGSSHHSTGMYQLHPNRADSAFYAHKNWLPAGRILLACSPSMSPSRDPARQDRMMHLTSGGFPIRGVPYDNHKAIIIRSWGDPDPDQPLWWMGPPGDRCNNDSSGNLFWGAPEWSTDEDYFTATGSKDIEGTVGDLYMVRLNYAGDSRLQAVIRGGGMNVYGHLWVKSGIRPARMTLDRASLAFAAYKKDSANPKPDTLKVTNAGDGPLPLLKVGPLPKWLKVSALGNGKDSVVKLAVSALRDSVVPGIYRDTVEITFGGGVDSAAFVVAFTYADPVLTTLMPRPAHVAVRPGDSLRLSALALDQAGKPMPGETVVAWSGPDALKPASDGWFRADTARWRDYRAVGASGGVQCTVRVSVSRTVLRVDAGAGPGDLLPGWVDDTRFARGGGMTKRSDSLQPMLAPNSAPARLYADWRQGFTGYAFDSLPDGRYRVRLHLTAAWGGSPGALTLRMENAKLLDAYRLPAAPDSARFPADVREVSVTVSDGNGLQIEAAGAGAPPALAGLEIWDEGLPIITLSSPDGPDTVRVGDTLAIRWEADPMVTSVGIQISPDSGATWLPVTRTRSVAVGEADWGNYQWPVPDSLDGRSLVTARAMIMVYDYFGADRDRSNAAFTIVADPALGIAGPDRPVPGFKLARAGAFLRVSGVAGPWQAALVDIRGRTVRAWGWSESQERDLPAGGLPPGVYRFVASGPGWTRSLLVPWP